MSEQTETDHFLDISDEICPMTFVKAKLMIERMGSGETACIRLQGTEPLDNVPRSIRDYGHEITSMKLENPDSATDGVHLLFMRKTT